MIERMTHITVVEKEPHELLPGEIALYALDQHWYIGCPECHGLGALAGHTVTKDNDNITVSPSILCGCGAHYFVEQNNIKWC